MKYLKPDLKTREGKYSPRYGIAAGVYIAMDVRRKWTLFLSLPGRPRKNITFGERLDDLKIALETALTEVDAYNREVSSQREASRRDVSTKAASGQMSSCSIVSAGKEWIKMKNSHWDDLTTTKYSGVIENYLVPAPFADFPFNQIQSHDLLNWFLSLRQGEDKISFSLVETIYSVVNQIFTFKASSSGINIPNPATGLRRKILPKGRRRPESPPDPFNEEQLKDFFNRAHKLANPDEFIVLSLMGRVGLRIGEAIAGERRDFFQEQKQFFVRQQYSDGTFKQPKHGIQRVVPVSKILLDRLNNHIAVARPGQEQLLCGKRSGELIQPFSRNRIRRLIEKICVEIGYKRRTSHDLRHSFAMTQILDGVSIKQLQEWLGHKDEVTTFVNYETLFSSRQGTLRDPCEV